MLKTTLRLLMTAVALPVIAAGPAAAPNIEVDDAYHDAGTVMEGSTKKISHTFIVKNTGDDTLIIEKVEPG